jgi:uncharacterized membrane protein YedE/YeeE
MAEPNLVGGFGGGALIGLAAVLLLALNGRIAGISGILAGVITSRDRLERSWRVIFLVGLITGPALYQLFYAPLRLQVISSIPALLAAGLMVGFGTRLGSGCTSGHGVCGIARLSPRSIVATAVFMLFGILAVYLREHLL